MSPILCASFSQLSGCAASSGVIDRASIEASRTHTPLRFPLIGTRQLAAIERSVERAVKTQVSQYLGQQHGIVRIELSVNCIFPANTLFRDRLSALQIGEQRLRPQVVD